MPGQAEATGDYCFPMTKLPGCPSSVWQELKEFYDPNQDAPPISGFDDGNNAIHSLKTEQNQIPIFPVKTHSIYHSFYCEIVSDFLKQLWQNFFVLF